MSVPIITSRQNPLIVRLSKLSEKKYRESEGLIRLDGRKLLEEAVKSGLTIEYVFVTEAMFRTAANLGVENRTSIVSDDVLAKLTDEKAPQGIVTIIKPFAVGGMAETPEYLPKESDNFRALLVSSVRDPGNLGTMIRTAYAFGIDCVYMSADCADIYSPKVIRAAMGNLFRQRLSVCIDEKKLIAELQKRDCPVYAAALRGNAEKLGEFVLPKSVCFAVGNEGHGLSDEVIDCCSGTVIIPMATDCESLNAAGAAGILCWEMRK